MKKILSILILFVLMAGLIAPVAVLAQKEKLKDCCTIKQDMSWKKGKVCSADNAKSPTTAKECKAAADWIDCTTSNTPCKLFKDIGIAGAHNTDCPAPGKADAKAFYYADQWGMICIVSVVISVTNWIFYLMMVAVVIVFVIAGAMFMMAGGDTAKTKSAKGMMILGVIGMVIALIAKLIPSVVKMVVGIS